MSRRKSKKGNNTNKPKNNRSNFKFNEVSNPEYRYFIDLCKLNQEELKTHLISKLYLFGYEPLVGDGWLYAKGNTPILVTAHMDTVHKERVKIFYEWTNEKGDHIITSPQGIGGDDRCGVFIILKLLEQGKRPYVLFCEDEEIGGIGSDKFLKTSYARELEKMRYMIEVDRQGNLDAVFYDCDNSDFTQYITKKTGFVENWGSFSDISNLAPFAGVAAVNLSCGYYHAHTLNEEVNMDEMFYTIQIVKELLEDKSEEFFEYVEAWDPYDDYGWGYYKYYGYGKTPFAPPEEEKEISLYILFLDNGKENDTVCYGKSETEAFGKFFMDYEEICFADIIDYYVWEDK